MKTLEETDLSKNEEQESFVPLPEVLWRNGFQYTLVIRNEYKALYAQGAVAHELFYVKWKKQRLHPRTEERVLKEVFPSNSSFGKGGSWSITKDRAKAMKRYEELPKPESNDRKRKQKV